MLSVFEIPLLGFVWKEVAIKDTKKKCGSLVNLIVGSTGTDCPGRWWSHCLWKCSRRGGAVGMVEYGWEVGSQS